MANKVDTGLSLIYIAEAMHKITTSKAGRKAFIKNNGENALNQFEAQVATQDNFDRKRTEKLIKKIKKCLKKERLKMEPKQDLCCIVS